MAALLLGACATAAPLPDPPAKPSKVGEAIVDVLQAVLGASNPRRGAPRQALPSKPGEQRIAVDAKLMRDEELSQLLAEFRQDFMYRFGLRCLIGP